MLASVAMWAAIILVLLVLIGCAGDPRTRYPPRPTYTTGGWDIYLAASMSSPERALVREAIREHLAAWAPYARGRSPSWRVRRPRVYVARPQVHYLRGPVNAAAQGVADHREQTLEVACGHKYTLPALTRTMHQLRHGPDPWRQDPALGWVAVLAAGARVVALLEARR